MPGSWWTNRIFKLKRKLVNMELGFPLWDERTELISAAPMRATTTPQTRNNERKALFTAERDLMRMSAAHLSHARQGYLYNEFDFTKEKLKRRISVITGDLPRPAGPLPPRESVDVPYFVPRPRR